MQSVIAQRHLGVDVVPHAAHLRIPSSSYGVGRGGRPRGRRSASPRVRCSSGSDGIGRALEKLVDGDVRERGRAAALGVQRVPRSRLLHAPHTCIASLHDGHRLDKWPQQAP